MSEPNIQELLSQALLNVSEILAPVVDACVGHRGTLIGRGSSPEVADALVVEYYKFLLGIVSTGMGR